MRQLPENLYDVATVLSVGKRDYQEDALATDFPEGQGYGFAVLCDGMGGHAAGEVASSLVLEAVTDRLRSESGNMQSFSHKVTEILGAATQNANGRVKAHTREHPKARGMGTTLVATVMLQDLLYWLSVGDSPLYLFRNNELQQLNEDHSMAPQIDFMVSKGLLSPELGANHPDRCALTSVILGANIERIDCPETPFRMQEGDVLIVSSDGLQFLADQEIASILGAAGAASAQMISQLLLNAIQRLDHPDQDNTSFAVIRFGGVAAAEEVHEVVWDDETADPVAANGVPARSDFMPTFTRSKSGTGPRT